MDWLDFLLNWILLPLIIIYGFVSWCKENHDTKFWNSPYEHDDKKEEKENRSLKDK